MKRLSLKTIFTVSMMCAALTALNAVPASAQAHDGEDRGKGGYERQCGLRHSWMEKLADGQKSQIKRLHLELRKEMSVLRAELGVKKAELKALTLRDAPDTQAIDRKTDEIMGIRKEIMRKRINHVIDVRKVLTPEQRVSFDSAIMSGHDGWRRGHRG